MRARLERIRAAALAAGLLAVPAAAGAQTADTPRVWAGVGAGAQGAPDGFVQRSTFDLYGEQASFDADHAFDGDSVFTAGGGVRVWRGLAATFAVTVVELQGTAAVQARLPHPFLFDQPRSASRDEGGRVREETAAHVGAGWVQPVGTRVLVVVSGGPSFFSVRQDVLTGVQFRETYPYDEVELTGVTSARRDGSATGWHAGVEAMVRVAGPLAVGGGVRATRATIDVDAAEGGTVEVKAGGTQVFGGVRVVF